VSVPGTRPSAIARIRALLSQPAHHYRPATTVFLDLNVDRVADEFGLATLGGERGAENRPTSDAQTMDDIEHKIVERIEAHKQDANVIYLDQLHTYDERMNALSFEERFATIQQAAPEAVGDFRAEATVGRDELFVLRRRLNESEIEREQFRKRHRIERPARLASPGKIILKAGILAILFIIEVVINGSFLAKANLGGLLGGAVQAVTFAALNIIASFFWGMVLIRLVNRRNYFLKLIGLLSFIAYLAFAIALNLTLSHLREIPPAVSLNDNVGQEVLHRPLDDSQPMILEAQVADDLLVQQAYGVAGGGVAKARMELFRDGRAAGDRAPLEDPDLKTRPRQITRAGQTIVARADDGDIVVVGRRARAQRPHRR